MTTPDPLATAQAWLAAEPDEDMQAELRALIDGPSDLLEARFDGRLQFGTAGLRAEVGAGPLRMNRLVVRQAAAGVAQYIIDMFPDAAERGIVVGYDARRKSDVFAADTARVVSAMGVPVKLFDRHVPTPVLSWAITEVHACAGIVVTASHNPPADNGYKVFLEDGSQIVSPYDEQIAARIDLFDPTNVALSDPDDARITPLGGEMVDEYVRFAAGMRTNPELAAPTVAYTAMHGVGGAVLVSAFAAAGYEQPVRVGAQHEPDGSFPTVAFPNPEEPGAMDLLIDAARQAGADVALANDPDADRLGVAIPQPDGSWRRLAGDEIGWLFADYILANTHGDDRLVVTTLVSSALLQKMAADYGVHAVETFTGFKWIAHEIREHPELRFVFGYEQALGYLVAARPRDKDGITAAVLFTEMVASAASRGRTMQDWLDDIARRYGRHVPGERSVRMEPAAAREAVERLRIAPPSSIAGRDVAEVSEYPEAGLLRFVLDGGVRVQVRPSGTEPKVKIYGEAVDADPQPFVDALAEVLTGQ